MEDNYLDISFDTLTFPVDTPTSGDGRVNGPFKIPEQESWDGEDYGEILDGLGNLLQGGSKAFSNVYTATQVPRDDGRTQQAYAQFMKSQSELSNYRRNFVQKKEGFSIGTKELALGILALFVGIKLVKN